MAKKRAIKKKRISTGSAGIFGSLATLAERVTEEVNEERLRELQRKWQEGEIGEEEYNKALKRLEKAKR